MHHTHTCLCCHQPFTPDPRTGERQKFCSKPGCRNASKAMSRARWAGKPENQGYWRETQNAERVREWRKQNPNHSKSKRRVALTTALQDDCLPSDPLLLGIISALSGSTVRDDIATTCRSLIKRGCEILEGGSATTKKP